MSKFVTFSNMKDKVVRVRVSSSAFASISSLASLYDISISQYIRFCISFAKKNKKDFSKFLKKHSDNYT